MSLKDLKTLFPLLKPPLFCYNYPIIRYPLQTKNTRGYFPSILLLAPPLVPCLGTWYYF